MMADFIWKIYRDVQEYKRVSFFYVKTKMKIKNAIF